MRIQMSVILLILLSIGLASIGQIAMKKGVGYIGSLSLQDLASTKIFSIITQPFIIIGFLIYLASAGIWIVVLSNADLSYAYPLVGIGYVATALLATVIFGEPMTVFKLVGILMIVAGAFVIVAKF